jgi:hypothetical protein
MDNIYGRVSRIKFNVIDYVYDKYDGLILSSKLRCKFNFKFKVHFNF